MSDVVRGRSAERNATKYERAGVISDFLLVLLTLLTDHLDGFEFLESPRRDSNLREDRIQRRRIVARQKIVPDLAGWEPSAFRTLTSARGLGPRPIFLFVISGFFCRTAWDDGS